MLYYDDGFELTDSAGLLKTWYFRANDAYDPDASGTGHQPAGFDQAMLLFEQFCVYSARLSVSFISNSNAAMRVGVFLSPDTTNPGSVAELMENGFCVNTITFGASNAATSGGAAHTVRTVNISCSNPAYFGSAGRRGYLSNPNFSGTAASGPVEQSYFGVFAFCMTGGVNYSILFDVTLSYDVYFWEPRKLSSSLASTILRQTAEEHSDPTHEQKIALLRDQLKAENPRYNARDFVKRMKEAGLFQPKDVYRKRRHLRYHEPEKSEQKQPPPPAKVHFVDLPLEDELSFLSVSPEL